MEIKCYINENVVYEPYAKHERYSDASLSGNTGPCGHGSGVDYGDGTGDGSGFDSIRCCGSGIGYGVCQGYNNGTGGWIRVTLYAN